MGSKYIPESLHRLYDAVNHITNPYDQTKIVGKTPSPTKYCISPINKIEFIKSRKHNSIHKILTSGSVEYTLLWSGCGWDWRQLTYGMTQSWKLFISPQALLVLMRTADIPFKSSDQSRDVRKQTTSHHDTTPHRSEKKIFPRHS